LSSRPLEPLLCQRHGYRVPNWNSMVAMTSTAHSNPCVLPADPAPWTLYLLECRNGALYAGITNNLKARYQAHLAGNGAKYTRSNPPVAILATAEFPDRSSASKAEWAIKQQPRHKKREAVRDFG